MTQKAISYLKRKELGIFYTPPKLTKILCDWAIKEDKYSIFEPSFGGCGFLEASCERLSTLNNQYPVKQLFGCDIDEDAFNNYLYPLYKSKDSSINDRFLKDNFLNLAPKDFSKEGFDTVLGNPPYISYHKMSDVQRKSVLKIAKDLNIKLDKRASLWAYFVLHSLSFIKKGGSLAFVLPGSFLQSNYAQIIREKVNNSFEDSVVIQIGERLFSSEGTDENTAVLLAEGFGKSSSEMTAKVKFVSQLDDLEEEILNWKKKRLTKRTSYLRTSYNLVPTTSLEKFEEIQRNLPFINLGEIADVSIGIVTGANDFFIINKETADNRQIPSKFLTSIFSKFRMTSGIEFTIDECNKRITENFRCLFVDTKGKKRIRDKNLKAYLDSFSKKERIKNITFGKRPIWHSPLYMSIPDAFFPYMHNSGPRLILNSAKTLCTNTIHRIFFKDRNGKLFLNKEKKFIAVSILSTFSQFSAELEGRTYGSGALKIEPSEAKRIKIIFPKEIDSELINKEFNAIDLLLRKQQEKQISDSMINLIIRERVDNFLINLFKDKNLEKSLKIISSELEVLRTRRKSW